jgi:hypothetical protein
MTLAPGEAWKATETEWNRRKANQQRRRLLIKKLEAERAPGSLMTAAELAEFQARQKAEFLARDAQRRAA